MQIVGFVFDVSRASSNKLAPLQGDAATLLKTTRHAARLGPFSLGTVGRAVETQELSNSTGALHTLKLCSHLLPQRQALAHILNTSNR